MKRLAFFVYDLFKINTNKWCRFFNKSQYWSYKQLKDFQLKRLKILSKKFNLNINSWKDFYNLHLTTKEDIRKYSKNKDFILEKNKFKKLTTHHSSGSTGLTLTTYGPFELQSIKSAIFERAWSWTGRKKKDWVLRLIAGEPKWKFYDWLRNVKPLNYRNITQEHIDFIVQNRPRIIHGQAGAIREITDLMIRKGRGGILKGIDVYLMSEDVNQHIEPLLEHYKNVYAGYGLSELCTVATQCYWEEYHVNMETTIVEIINGEIVVTDLFNTITPIIRYRTGDYGKMIKKSDGFNCMCGLEHDIIDKISGRRIDYYNGLEVKRPLGWWCVSPISHKYMDIIKSWKVVVDIKKKQFILYVVWKGKKNNLKYYKDFIKKNTGLDLVIKTKSSIYNIERMCLLEVKK